MTALFSWFLSNPTVIAILAGIVGAIGWGFKQRLAGAKAERDKQARERLAAREIADEVDNDVGALPPDAARKELGKWGR